MKITQIIQIHPEVAKLLIEQQRRIEQQAEHITRLQQDIGQLGRKNTALAAEIERAELAEQQLAAADRRIAELEVALQLAKLPEESREAVWREAA